MNTHNLTILLILTLGLISKGTCGEPNVTFDLSFDHGTLKADSSGGSPEPGEMKELRSHAVPGFNQKAGLSKLGFNKPEGENLSYAAEGNISPKEGTMVVWLKGENYDPSTSSDGTHKSYMLVDFKNGEEWLKLYLYEYAELPAKAMFYWSSSWSKNPDFWVVGMPLPGISKGQWFQIAATWSDKLLRIYLNGEFKGQTPLGPEAKEAASMAIDPAKSFIHVRRSTWAPVDSGMETSVDDIKIYNTALTEEQVKDQFAVATEKLPGFSNEKH